jgi:hypothetical protein
LAALLLTTVLFSFSLVNDGAIQGKVTPEGGSQMVFVIAGRDTVTAQVSSGQFIIPKVKPGTYTVWVKGIPPLRDTSIVNVPVIEGDTTDVGEIMLLP